MKLLTYKTSQLFLPARWVSLGAAKKCNWDMQLWQITRTIWDHMLYETMKQRRKSSIEKKGKLGWAVLNSPLEESGNGKYSGFPLAELWQFLIGYTVARQGENLSSSCRKVVSVTSFQKCKVYLFLLGSVAWEYVHESSPFWPSDFILVRFPFTNFLKSFWPWYTYICVLLFFLNKVQ